MDRVNMVMGLVDHEGVIMMLGCEGHVFMTALLFQSFGQGAELG
jgi:hypothetical protein